MRKLHVNFFLVLFFFSISINLHAQLVGDINNDRNIDLIDVILSLKTINGLSSSEVIITGDINEDNKVGLEEAIYGLIYLANNYNIYATGNEDFRIEDAILLDAMADFRGEFNDNGNDNLPLSMDYTNFMPDVASQGSTGSCTSWATGYYFKTYQEKIEEGWDINQNMFSPMYLYAMQCKHYTTTELCKKNKNCTPKSLITSWEILKKFGCAKWDSMPYKDHKLSSNRTIEIEKYASEIISEAVHQEARQYRVGEKTKFSNLNEVKHALTNGPVILAIIKYKSSHLNLTPSPENNYLMYDSTKKGGHAILCVGYDDAKFGVGALKFINSWGKDWANEGYSWIKYSDYEKIVLDAMTMKDLQNPYKNSTTTIKADTPKNVKATKNIGPYVDIIWDKVSNAKYYRIFRAKVGEPSSYIEVGTTNNTNHRDTPEPGIQFYYSVISVNDIGSSIHHATDNDDKSYVDIGIAKGHTLQKPKLTWTNNDDEIIRSYFKVWDVDPAADKIEVFISLSSTGPWASFGWIKAQDFYITWSETSEYLGKKPFIKIVASNSDSVSENSDPVQIGLQINVPVEVAKTTSFDGLETTNNIQLIWKTDNGVVDFFEIWRYKATSDWGGNWTLIGYADKSENSYYDSSAQPGISYYYGIVPVYQGTYGIVEVINNPLSIPITKPNLFLYEYSYNYAEITNPVFFNLKVWNNGGTPISDYTISIKVYDWNDKKIYKPFSNFKAKDFANSEQLPLNQKSEHELFISLNLPSFYNDGHYYSWIIELNPTPREIQELYYDDNILWSNDFWWSNDLNPKPNIKIDNIAYNYGQLINPVHFDLFVSNTGGIKISDYKIRIIAYDWNMQKAYYPFNDFYASSVADWWEIPLQSGKSHTLSFDRSIPFAYADSHYYYWQVVIDPDNEIDESNEDDNFVQSIYAWQLQNNKRNSSSDIPNANLYEDSFNANNLKSTTMKDKNKDIDSEKIYANKTKASNKVYLNSLIGSTRPFCKQRIKGKRIINKQEESYVGPIRYKKPPFCINHAE